VVSLHGGQLLASSPGLGQGCTFTLRLPLYFGDSTSRHDVVDLSQGTSSQQSVLPKPNMKRILNILVVDDAKSNRKLLRHILEGDGHVVSEAEDGQICVDMVEQSPECCDLIFMDFGNDLAIHSDVPLMLDVEMPRLNGPLATKQLRAIGFSGPVIGVTGNVLAEDVSYFKSCGANRVLSKPLSRVELRAVVTEMNIVSSKQSALA
jgi:CheY-like chemotaxis protein